MAQLAEQLTCNQQVIGSSPIIGFQQKNIVVLYFGWVPEWPKGADCKSVSDAFEGSNPSPSIWLMPKYKYCLQKVRTLSKRTLNGAAGWSSLEARRAHNPKVIGSNPIPAIFVKNKIVSFTQEE